MQSSSGHGDSIGAMQDASPSWGSGQSQLQCVPHAYTTFNGDEKSSSGQSPATVTIPRLTWSTGIKKLLRLRADVGVDSLILKLNLIRWDEIRNAITILDKGSAHAASTPRRL